MIRDPRPLPSEVIVATPEQLIPDIYTASSLPGVLDRYAYGSPVDTDDPRPTDEDDVRQALSDYAHRMGVFCMSNGSVDLTALRRAYECVIDDMNRIAAQKLDPPPSFGRKLLTRLGVLAPIHQSFSSHDDAFWEGQFMDEYHRDRTDHLQTHETDELFLGRFFGDWLCKFALPPYSYLQQATRRG